MAYKQAGSVSEVLEGEGTVGSERVKFGYKDSGW